MTIWYKQGVQGDLSNQCRKCMGRIHDQVYSYSDMFITAIRDGNHMAGSLHYNGNAFDFRKGKAKLNQVASAAGQGFDVIEHDTHFHVEWDPK